MALPLALGALGLVKASVYGTALFGGLKALSWAKPSATLALGGSPAVGGGAGVPDLRTLVVAAAAGAAALMWINRRPRRQGYR
jgi:hypothetical protein